jgi:LPXTG-motif cell wall-anchored protein
MHLITALIRIALSVVFGTAGITKLLDQRGAREAAKNFGAPESWAPAVAVLLPIAELGTAIGLLLSRSMYVSALAALLLLCVFIVAISVNLARGRTHDCHCFGQLHSRPLGWSTLARNLIFALGAGIVLWQSRAHSLPSVFSTRAEIDSSGFLLLIGLLVIVSGFLLYSKRRQKRLSVNASPALKGLPVNSLAPEFELDAYAGGKSSLAQLLAYGKAVLLIFTNPTCGPCVVLFEEVRLWQESHSEQLTIALISFGTIKENFVNVARNGLGQVLLQREREVAEQYGANVTPTAVVVNANGRIASPVAAGADEIRKLLTTILANSDGSNNHSHRSSGR